MKLTRTLNRKWTDKEGKEREFYHYRVTIPEKYIEELGWEKDEDLGAEVKGNHLRIWAKKPAAKRDKGRSK